MHLSTTATLLTTLFITSATGLPAASRQTISRETTELVGIVDEAGKVEELHITGGCVSLVLPGVRVDFSEGFRCQFFKDADCTSSILFDGKQYLDGGRFGHVGYKNVDGKGARSYTCSRSPPPSVQEW